MCKIKEVIMKIILKSYEFRNMERLKFLDKFVKL